MKTASKSTTSPHSQGPLEGLTVIDLSRVLVGPFCTMVLADLGARVIKVESPQGGDDARHFGPFVKGESAYFGSLNRGKASIVLDLKAAQDRAIFEALLERADVLVENFRPGVMDRLGYGWAVLSERFPQLVMASVSGFGQTGPLARRPAYDMIVQAMGGLMHLTGHPGGPPTRVGTSIGDIAAGLFTAIGVLAALHERGRRGEGQQVDVSMLDCQIAILENALARYFATGEVPQPLGARHPSITPFESFATADQPVVIAAGNDRLFALLCEALGRQELLGDVRFVDNASRTANASALRQALEATLRQRPAKAWLAILVEAGVPCGPINDVAQALAQPQVAARRMVIKVGTSMRAAGNPIKLSGHPDPATRGAAPALDGDREALIEELQITSRVEKEGM